VAGGIVHDRQTGHVASGKSARLARGFSCFGGVVRTACLTFCGRNFPVRIPRLGVGGVVGGDAAVGRGLRRRLAVKGGLWGWTLHRYCRAGLLATGVNSNWRPT
jgi:hypothetical protein